MIDNPLFENIIIEESTFLVEEGRVKDIDVLLEELPLLRGASFISQLKEITVHPSFNLVKNENNIFSTGGESSEDYDNLLKTARKAGEHGYRVFILPNPKGIRTADYIFERKGVFKMFDLKTISGKNSVGNRLKESIGQTNCVLLNIVCDYNVRNLTLEIKRYFEANTDAFEVLIFTGRKEISIKRNIATSRGFLKMMMKSFRK
jgi:hypothetical protein